MLEQNLKKENDVRSFLVGEKNVNFDSVEVKLLNCHGLKLKFNIYDKNLSVLFDKIFSLFDQSKILNPKENNEINVNWYSSNNLKAEWNDSGDHQCRFSKIDNNKLVIQRDFVCHHKTGTEIQLFTEPSQSDGVFNFLRYFIPITLINQKKFVFHSSCVLNDKNQATLFLGHSGYGKSTISSMFPKESVLGDDMQLVFVKDKKLFVEPTHLGQSITNWDKQGQTYPVKNIYWLQKADVGKNVKIQEMSLAQQRLKILGSFSGLFWDQLNVTETNSVFNFLQIILNTKELKYFLFSLKSEVRQYD